MSGLDEQLDRLYASPLEGFIAVRNALVKEMGDPARAAELKKLTKPPVSAWAVNQLRFEAGDDVDELLEAGRALRAAQTSGAGAEDIRAAAERRRRAVTRLTVRARELLVAAGHGTSDATLHRISNTLEALAVYGGAEGAPAAGRLNKDVEPPGFDALAGTSIPPPKPSPPAREAAPGDHAEPESEPAAAGPTAVHAALERLTALRKAERQAQGIVEKAEEEERETELEAVTLAQRAIRARDRADAAKTRLAEARAALGEATTMVERAQRELEEARSAAR